MPPKVRSSGTSVKFSSKLLEIVERYNPNTHSSLCEGVKSFMEKASDHVRLTTEFVLNVQRKIYCIHNYNLLAAQVTFQYPTSEEWTKILISYIELEYVVLYGRRISVDKKWEYNVSQRVLRTLKIVLQDNKTCDRTILFDRNLADTNLAILNLFSKVNKEYLRNDRFIMQIGHKLLKQIEAVKYPDPINPEILRMFSSLMNNLCTSDYGTDDSDSDRLTPTNPQLLSEVHGTSSTVVTPIVENTSSIQLSKTVNDNQSNKKRKNEVINDKTLAITTNLNNIESIVLSSDSEGENTVDLSKNKRKKHNRQSIVTFEIIDDDDDDDGNTYMTYLHREIGTEDNVRQDPMSTDCGKVKLENKEEQQITEEKNPVEVSVDQNMLPENTLDSNIKRKDDSSSEKSKMQKKNPVVTFEVDATKEEKDYVISLQSAIESNRVSEDSVCPETKPDCKEIIDKKLDFDLMKIEKKQESETDSISEGELTIDSDENSFSDLYPDVEEKFEIGSITSVKFINMENGCDSTFVYGDLAFSDLESTDFINPVLILNQPPHLIRTPNYILQRARDLLGNGPETFGLGGPLLAETTFTLGPPEEYHLNIDNVLLNSSQLEDVSGIDDFI